MPFRQAHLLPVDPRLTQSNRRPREAWRADALAPAAVDRRLAIRYPHSMTAAEIIREIDGLPPAELAEVVRHTKKLEKVRQLSPEEIGVLVDQFVEATDS